MRALLGHARFLLQEKQWQNLFREGTQKAQTWFSVCLPQRAHSSPNTTSALEQDTDAGTSPLPVCSASCSPVTETPCRGPQGKPHLPQALPRQEPQQRNDAACFRLQGAGIYPLTPHPSPCRAPCSSFDSKPFIIHKAKGPDCQTGGDLTSPVQCISGVNFLLTLFN